MRYYVDYDKKFAEWCCDADPDKRPGVATIREDIERLFGKMEQDGSNSNAWNTIYYNNVKLLSRLEKE